LQKFRPGLTLCLNIKADSNITVGGQFGDALIFPAYFVGNGWETTVRVINTSSEAVVAKVVLFAGNDSHEVRDFNIYLSANDEWTATIKIDDDGVAKVISTDDSSPLTDGTMASADKPMKSDSIDVATGYIQVIGCAATADNSGAHGLHQDLREAYKELTKVRYTDNNVIFKNGVITSGAILPYIDANKLTPVTSTTNQKQFNFKAVTDGSLIGDVRITDTVNGKDMVMPAVALNNVTEDDRNATLLFVEGEAANIADRDINSTVEYSAQLDNDAQQFNIDDSIYMTYGDTSNLANNQLIITSPFKRMLVNKYKAGLNDIVDTFGFTGVTVDDKSNITDYGYISAYALVYDKSENQASASQFSPASTPTLNFHYEVSASEGNSVETDNLSYYLNQAGSSFSEGYVILKNATSGAPINGIVTQMMATEAAGKVITNWITPAAK